MSEPTKNLYQKLLHIQQHINGLGKDKAAFGYKYVTGDKVLEHIKPLMNDQGLLLKQEVISIENTRQDYKTKSGETSEINSKVMMRFTWIDAETGEKDENLFGANGQNAWDKGVGSALTYGERYFLLKFFHIATDEDDIDNPERKAAEIKQQQKAAKPEMQQAEYDKALGFINAGDFDGLRAFAKGFNMAADKGKMLAKLVEEKKAALESKPVTAPPAAATAPAQAEPGQKSTRTQNEEIVRLLNNVVITRQEKAQMLLGINKMTEEYAKTAIENLRKTIIDREAESNAELQKTPEMKVRNAASIELFELATQNSEIIGEKRLKEIYALCNSAPLETLIANKEELVTWLAEQDAAAA